MLSWIEAVRHILWTGREVAVDIPTRKEERTREDGHVAGHVAANRGGRSGASAPEERPRGTPNNRLAPLLPGAVHALLSPSAIPEKPLESPGGAARRVGLPGSSGGECHGEGADTVYPNGWLRPVPMVRVYDYRILSNIIEYY